MLKSKPEILAALRTVEDYLQRGEHKARRTGASRLDRLNALDQLEELIETMQHDDVEVRTRHGRKIR